MERERQTVRGREGRREGMWVVITKREGGRERGEQRNRKGGRERHKEGGTERHMEGGTDRKSTRLNSSHL